MIFSSEAKVGELHSPTAIGDQYVLGFQVPMVYPNGMAEVDRIQNLEERILGHGVIVKILTFLRDTREEITFRAKLKDHKCAVVSRHNLNHGHHIGMMASLMMKLDLPLLECLLSGIQANLVQSLHRVRDIRVDIDRCVYDAIGTHSQYARQSQPVGEDFS